MPPKKAVAAASGEVSSLSPTETRMLAVICILQGDVPNVNFEIVAKYCGIKFGKNARASCKRLFDKIKASHPEIVIDGKAATASGSGAKGSDDNEVADAGSDGDDEGPAPKRAKVAQKAIVKNTAVKKPVAPKKKVVGKKAAMNETDEANVEEEGGEPMEEDQVVEDRNDSKKAVAAVGGKRKSARNVAPKSAGSEVNVKSESEAVSTEVATSIKKVTGKKTAGKKPTLAPKKSAGKMAVVPKASASKSDSEDVGGEQDGEDHEVLQSMEDVELEAAGKNYTSHIDVSSPSSPSAKDFALPEDRLPGIDQPVEESDGSSASLSEVDQLIVIESSPEVSAPEVPTPEVLDPELPAPDIHESVAEGSSASVDASGLEQLAAAASAVEGVAEGAVSQPEQSLSVSTSVAVSALAYFVTEQLSMHIDGYDYPYINQDVIDAQLHGITLRHWILWKHENGVDRATVEGR
ncbi:hypothetical protein VTL71DRAFT_2734 [Oculimacula yallundae]|uniref:Uncharacterized protein n=1 Tax=Oculimacula yallundae TaxID=86028 RepID=A0ABR4CAW3_9HELO